MAAGPSGCGWCSKVASCLPGSKAGASAPAGSSSSCAGGDWQFSDASCASVYLVVSASACWGCECKSFAERDAWLQGSVCVGLPATYIYVIAGKEPLPCNANLLLMLPLYHACDGACTYLYTLAHTHAQLCRSCDAARAAGAVVRVLGQNERILHLGCVCVRWRLCGVGCARARVTHAHMSHTHKLVTHARAHTAPS